MIRKSRLVRSVLGCCSLALVISIHAQDTTIATVERTFKPSIAADLVIAQRPIITLRAEVFGNSPARRIANIHARIEEVMEQGGACKLSVTNMFGGHVILIDGKPLVFITALDIDPTQGEVMEEVVQLTLTRLHMAIGENRELHDSHAMLRNGLFVLLYTALFALSLLLLGRLRRWIRLRTDAIIKHSIARSGIKGDTAQSNTIFLLAQRLILILSGALTLASTYFWLTAVLERIPLTRAWGEQMYSLLFRAGLWVLDGVIGALPGIAVVVFIFLVTRWTVRSISGLFMRIANGDIEVSWLDAATAAPTKQIVSILIWLFAIAIAYPYIPGSSSGAFQGVSVLAGVMLSLGSSGVVSQAAAGLILMYNRVIRVGEFVIIGDTSGTVTRIGYFNTSLRTGYEEVVIVPNTTFLSTSVVNLSRFADKGVLFKVSVGIGYETPWRQVHEMLLEAAARTPGLAADPAPWVNQHALGDFAVDYRLSFVVQAPNRGRPTVTALQANILDVFNENNVQIMTPSYEGDPQQAKVVDVAAQAPPLVRKAKPDV